MFKNCQTTCPNTIEFQLNMTRHISHHSNTSAHHPSMPVHIWAHPHTCTHPSTCKRIVESQHRDSWFSCAAYQQATLVFCLCLTHKSKTFHLKFYTLMLAFLQRCEKKGVIDKQKNFTPYDIGSYRMMLRQYDTTRVWYIKPKWMRGDRVVSNFKINIAVRNMIRNTNNWRSILIWAIEHLIL